MIVDEGEDRRGGEDGVYKVPGRVNLTRHAGVLALVNKDGESPALR